MKPFSRCIHPLGSPWVRKTGVPDRIRQSTGSCSVPWQDPFVEIDG